MLYPENKAFSRLRLRGTRRINIAQQHRGQQQPARENYPTQLPLCSIQPPVRGFTGGMHEVCGDVLSNSSGWLFCGGEQANILRIRPEAGKDMCYFWRREVGWTSEKSLLGGCLDLFGLDEVQEAVFELNDASPLHQRPFVKVGGGRPGQSSSGFLKTSRKC